MRFKAKGQPYCRCCGKLIKKFVVKHYFGEKTLGGQRNDWSVYHSEEAKTKDEAQRYINERVVSIRYGYARNVIAGAWDGETYEDEFFCSQDCAAGFGRMAARLYPMLETKAANDARIARLTIK